MDIRLGSGIDGVEVAQKIRQPHPCKVSFLTGSSETATRLWINATDPPDVLVKQSFPST
jgi:CheY-like chemotaxis protein